MLHDTEDTMPARAQTNSTNSTLSAGGLKRPNGRRAPCADVTCYRRALVPTLVSRVVRSWAVLGGFFVCVVMAHRLLGCCMLMPARECLTS